MSKFFLTTAIDYANGDPHLGHALEKIGADVIARYRRLAGDDVHFLMGMDEHGQKVKQAADERGVSPQAFVDRVAAKFEDMWQRLRTVAAQGTAVLLISTELDEIMALADRVAVIQKGRLVGTMARDEVDTERLALLMGGRAA